MDTGNTGMCVDEVAGKTLKLTGLRGQAQRGHHALQVSLRCKSDAFTMFTICLSPLHAQACVTPSPHLARMREHGAFILLAREVVKPIQNFT